MRLANEVFCADLRTPKEGAQHIFEECLEFYDSFQRNRIYFSEDVCLKMDKLVELIGETNMAVRLAPNNLDFGKDIF